KLGQAMQAARLSARNAAERWIERAKTGKFDLPDGTDYAKIAPPNMPRDVLKERIHTLMAGGGPEVRGMIRANADDQFAPSKKLPDGRFQLVREVSAQVDFVKGLDPFRAKIYVYLETGTPFDPMNPGDTPPKWDITKFEVVRLSFTKGPTM